MSKLRFRVVETAFKKQAVEVPTPDERPSGYFGQNVFNRAKMFKYLTKKAYGRITDCIDNGTPLDRETADAVAVGMKKWAIEMGATHYTHWFHPLTEGTAEKHDAFVEHDGKGGMVEEFSGKLLIQQEPDASSFPNGGIRNTFEARGYSAWDPSSPAFIVGDTLCIPTIFIAYTGESLDYKAPLLKALEAVNKAATDVCHYFNPDVKKVYAYLGWEQEYFLVDEGLYAARPDLLLTGRTLMGHESSKNQQLEDHYFGAIPTRVMEFMKELEIESLKLGIPLKTRHNEVAPNQFELAPIFEECNLANDHNLLVMALMRKISHKHGFRVLLHEKPFKGVNGSGKHNNWSLGTDTGILLMAPGKTPEENLRFITFIVNVLMAVYRHNGLLKASISSATNAHRLGANEAPPAIISLSRWYPLKERGTYYGFFSARHNLGEFFSFLFVGSIVTFAGWQAGFFGSAAAGAIGVIVILCWLHDTPESKGLPPVETLAHEKSRSQADRSVKEIQKQVLKTPAVWILAAASAFMYISRYAINGWGVLFLQEAKGFSDSEAISIVSINALLGILGTVLSGWFSDKLCKGDRKLPALLFGILNSVALTLFLYGGTEVWVNVLAMVLFGIAIGVLICFLGGLMAVDIVPRKATGAALGVVGVASYCAAGIQDVASGWLIDAHITVAADGTKVYDFAPVAFFWIAASVISFLLPLLNWKSNVSDKQAE